MNVKIRSRLLNYPVTIIRNGTRKYTVPAVTTSNEAQEVIYPPISDLSYRGKKKREKQIWHEKIKKLDTVEEKIFGLNMPRYYGWKSFQVREDLVFYNSLPHAQYVTRTHLIDGLPDFYNSLISLEDLDAMVQMVKGQVEDNITFEYINRLRQHEWTEEILANEKQKEDIVTNSIVQQLNRTLVTNLGSKLPHLLESAIDYEPRVEAFWFIGGMDPPLRVKKAKEGQSWVKPYANDPVDRSIQYVGSPVLHLRDNLPLREIMSLKESEDSALHVPQFKFDPRVLGYTYKRQHGTTIPGFWPGDPCEFGSLSYHKRGHLLCRPKRCDDEVDALAVQAIFASYSWLLSLASYQGFNTFNDLTYPLVTQTVITNGHWWSFCVYQLNTLLLHSEHIDENPRRNICWMTPPMKLFDTIENGKIHGFNDDVLKLLLKFYNNVPQKRVNTEMKPYLGESVKTIADIDDDERRIWLEAQFKHLMANRPRHRLVPEVYNWQNIYQVRHKTRPMDKKREPWEYGINPMRRRLNEHVPRYVPKCLRENPKLKKVGRFAKTYYPDV